MTAANNAPLNDYIGPVLAYKKLIAVVAIAVAALGVAAGLAAPTSYSSTTSILVYPVSADPTKVLGTDDARIDMPTELRIATSQAVIDSASARMTGTPERIGPRTLADSVNAFSPKESSILDITVDAPTAAKAKAGADAVAGAYLDFRADLANSNKAAAEASINSRLSILNEQSAELERAMKQVGPTEQVILAVEQSSVDSEIAAQQVALANLSTLTIDATRVIDVAVTPQAPSGLGLIPIVIGSIAGGLVLGVMAAFAAAALKTASGGSGSSESSTDTSMASAVSPVSAALPVATGPAPTGELDAVALKAKSAMARLEESSKDDLLAELDAKVAAAEVAAVEVEVAASEVAVSEVAVSEVAVPEVATLASVSERENERRETYTVQPVAEERRALHIDRNSQPALTATPDMDSLLEQLQKMGQVGPIVGLTLGEEGVGTSIAVAFDLADALQSLGAKVLMIDACHDDPLLAGLLGVDESPGLAEVLTGQATLRSAVRPVGGLRGLDGLTIGNATSSTVDAITGAPFERLLAEAKVEYHSILIIAGAVTDTVSVPTLAALSDGLIVGTTQQPGEQASAELCKQLAGLPAPTLEFLSEMLVVERSDGAVVVGAASM